MPFNALASVTSEQYLHTDLDAELSIKLAFREHKTCEIAWFPHNPKAALQL